ncbi:MAG: class I SAM-dependent methyltransferase [Solirubrobacteraceae bacterium]
MSASDQLQVNASAWQRGDHVAEYANRRLLPVEVVLLVRYRDVLSRRTLEVGCGAGRILGYVTQLGGEAHGIDISPAMVEHCRSRYPAAHTQVGDLADIARSAEGPFEAVLALDNVLDVFDDADRRRVLADLRGLLAPDGLLIFSSHNLAYVDRGAHRDAGRTAGRGRVRGLLSEVVSRPLSNVARAVARIPGRRRNRKRLGPLQRRGDGYAIINDSAHDYALLHYYIGRDDQERQLRESGYELVECLDADGRPVGPGEPNPDPWLHYVARSVID